MRWLLGGAAEACHACGAELERGATWCGACGARAAGEGDAEQAAVAEGPADGPADQPPLEQPPLARRALVAVVALALVALAVAWQLRSAAPEPVLGQLGQSTGMSATGPPPSGLRLAWSHESAGAADGWSVGWPMEVAARGDRVRVANLVVDAQRGEVVGITPALWQVTGIERTVVDGRELLVVDTLSGEVRSRATLPDDVLDGPLWHAHRGRGASLLRSEEQSVLVADDGSVVAEVDGHFLDYVDRAFGDPAAFPVRARVGEDELRTPLRLVRADTGEVVADMPEAETRVVDVSGDLALVATTDATIDFDNSSPAGSGGAWTVALLDARTGEQRTQWTTTSTQPPRLVGTFDDGTAVVASSLGDQYPLQAVTPAGEVSTIAWLGQRPRRHTTGLIVDSSALSGAAVTGDVLAITHGVDEVIGLDRNGDRRWELDAPDTAAIRAGDGYVALVGDEGRSVRLVRASDGESVATLRPPDEDWVVGSNVGLPIGVIDGHVGLGLSGHHFTPHQGPLVETTWLDLRTGEDVALDDVFGRFAGDEEGIGADWVFHGIVTDEHGEPEPVFSRTQPPSRFELLEPGEGFRAHRLDLPPTNGAPAFGVASAGASVDRFAAWHEGVRNPADLATIVLDRTTGASTTVEGVRGVVLLGDLLLAEELDESYGVAALVAVDPVTGEERWRAEPHAPLLGEEVLLVDEDLVMDVGVARVTARSTQDGVQRWTHASEVALSGDALLGPHHVVAATTDGHLVALDRRDGEIVWRTALGAPVASLTGAGDHVVVGTHDGLVIHLDGRGREVQRIAVGTGAVHEVAALGETVVAVVDERVIGLRADGTGITRDDEVELP